MSMLLAMMLTSITARGIINPVVVAAPAGANSALYLVLRNSSRDEDRLVRVTCDCARRIEVMAARDGGLHLEGESVAMPPERLVELRPGASRHLVLLGLRRALVAGEAVEMTFHYARGSEARDVRIVSDPHSGWAAGLAASGPPRLEPMAELAGWCWRGAVPQRRRTDVHCFSPAYGPFMQEHYVVESLTPYERHVMYMQDLMSRHTRYRFSSSEAREDPAVSCRPEPERHSRMTRGDCRTAGRRRSANPGCAMAPTPGSSARRSDAAPAGRSSGAPEWSAPDVRHLARSAPPRAGSCGRPRRR